MSANAPPESAQDFADSGLAFIEARIPAIDTVSVLLNQREKPGGDIYDVMDIGFTIPPYDNVFYVHPDAKRNWKRLALHSISLKANQVLSIYAGYQDRQDVIPLYDPLPSDYPDGVVPGDAPPVPIGFE